MVASLNNFIQTLGDPGRFQVVAFILLWSNVFPLALNNIVNVFYTYVPDHHCKISENNTWGINGSIPFREVKGKMILDKCQEWTNPADHESGTIDCRHGWEYEYKNKEKEWNIVGEWDLVCERSYLRGMANSVYFLGVMVGGPVGGWIADKFGRKPVILFDIYVQAVLGLAVYFVHDLKLYMAVRFMQAMVLQSLQAASYTVAMEFLRSKHRVAGGILLGQVWSLTPIALALVAYGLGDWRYIQLAITLPSVISFAYFWFIPESLRWLISQKKTDSAEALSRKIASFNKIDLPEDVRNQLDGISKECQSESSPDKKYGFMDLVRTPTIRKYTLIMCLVWFTNSLVVYGVSFSLSKLGGNLYLSFIISGCIEFPSRGLMVIILNKFGRKKPIAFCILMSGILCIISPLVLLIDSGESIQYLAATIAIVGKAFMASSFCSIPIFTAELFPTVIRVLAQGVAIFASRIGGIVAPQIILLADLVWKPVPLIICGTMGIIAGCTLLLLPDTHNKPLPDMIEDVETTAVETMDPLLLSSAKMDIEKPKTQETSFLLHKSENGTNGTMHNGDEPVPEGASNGRQML